MLVDVLHPFVGCLFGQREFRLDGREVAELVEFPLRVLLEPESKHCRAEFEKGRIVPYYAYCGHRVWGATAMVLCEFEVVLRGYLDRFDDGEKR